MRKLNKKGFTLIELLAVIVILAVLILLALPNVLRLMNNAEIDSFKVEAQTILSAAEQAYTANLVSGTAGSTKCWVYNDTSLGDYVDIKTSYEGKVVREGEGTFKIYLHDKSNKYYINGKDKNEISSLNRTDIYINTDEAPSGFSTTCS